MLTQTIEKTAVIAQDGTPLSIMERPEGLGAFVERILMAPPEGVFFMHAVNALAWQIKTAFSALRGMRSWISGRGDWI